MRTRCVRLFFWGALALALAPLSAQADHLRCQGRLVGEGDTVIELKARCGPPDHREIRPVLRAEGIDIPQAVVLPGSSGTRSRAVVATSAFRQVRYVREQIETWTYVGDRGALARLVTVRRGRVERIRTLGKLDIPDDPGCRRALFDQGARPGAVYLGCGPPDDRAVWEEEEELEVGGVIRRELVVHETWTYNPGRGRLLRILTFRNGKLVKIETGGRAP